MRVDIPVGLQLLFGTISYAAVEEDGTSGLVIEVFDDVMAEVTAKLRVIKTCFEQTKREGERGGERVSHSRVVSMSLCA